MGAFYTGTIRSQPETAHTAQERRFSDFETARKLRPCFPDNAVETHGESKYAQVYRAAAGLAEMQIDLTPAGSSQDRQEGEHE